MRPQRERRRYFRMRFMCLCSQVVNPAIDELRGALIMKGDHQKR
jgi:hypothetical protein